MYIITGMGLIISALVFAVVALDFLEQHPDVHSAGPYAVFFIVLYLGTFWGGIVIWKGFGLISDSRQETTQNG